MQLKSGLPPIRHTQIVARGKISLGEKIIAGRKITPQPKIKALIYVAHTNSISRRKNLLSEKIIPQRKISRLQNQAPRYVTQPYIMMKNLALRKNSLSAKLSHDERISHATRIRALTCIKHKSHIATRKFTSRLEFQTQNQGSQPSDAHKSYITGRNFRLERKFHRSEKSISHY